MYKITFCSLSDMHDIVFLQGNSEFKIHFFNLYFSKADTSLDIKDRQGGRVWFVVSGSPL